MKLTLEGMKKIYRTYDDMILADEAIAYATKLKITEQKEQIKLLVLEKILAIEEELPETDKTKTITLYKGKDFN